MTKSNLPDKKLFLFCRYHGKEAIIVRFLKPGMLRPSDYFILKVFPQVIEIIAVACDAHDQVTVELRMLLGLTERFGIYHIELYVMPVEAEVAPYERRQLLITSFVLEELRGEFLVQKCPASPEMVNL